MSVNSPSDSPPPFQQPMVFVPPPRDDSSKARKAGPEAGRITPPWQAYFQQLKTNGGGGGGGAVSVFDFTLSGALTINAANTIDPTTVAVGSQLAIFLRQDASGGWVITFDDPPFRGNVTNLGVNALTWTLVCFLAQVDPADSTMKWWFQSLITNQT